MRFSYIYLIVCIGIWGVSWGSAQAQTSLSTHGVFRTIEVFFGSGSAMLDSMAKKSLAQIDTNLLIRNDVHFVLNGYTDPVGSDASNRKLAERRIREAIIYMNSIGIDETRIMWNAHGEKEAKHAKPNEFAQWRKVEIKPIIMKQ